MKVKGNNVIGLKVITIKQGRQITAVKDVIYDPSEHSVKALLIDEGGWFSDARIIPIEMIRSIGIDALLIDDETKIQKASQVKSKIANIASEGQYLTKTKIITEDGTELGRVSDIYFDAKTGKVTELEVTQGAFKTLQSGTKYVQVEDIITIGEDATIVKKYTLDRFEEQEKSQGIKGAYYKTSETVAEKTKNVKDQTPSLLDQIKQKTEEISIKTQQKAQEIKEHPKTAQMIKTAKEKSEDISQTASSKSNDFRNHPDTQNALNTVKMHLEKAKEAAQTGIDQGRKKMQEQSNQYEQRKDDTKTDNTNQPPQAKVGYPAPVSGQYQPVGSLGGKSEVTLTQGKTTPPNNQSEKQAYTLVDETKHDK